MCDCLHYLFHHLHNGSVQICGWLLQSCRGKAHLNYKHTCCCVHASLYSHELSFFLQIFGFIATIAFALDFYLIFNELATFLKQGGQSNEEPSGQQGNKMSERVPET